MTYRILVGNKKFNVDVLEVGSGTARVSVDGQPYELTIENYGEVAGTRAPVTVAVPAAPPPAAAPAAADPAPPPPRPPAPSPTGGTPLHAPMPGVIVNVLVRVGDTVTEDQTVVTLEAMKMENNIAAPAAGTIRDILVSKGSQLATGDVILILE